VTVLVSMSGCSGSGSPGTPDDDEPDDDAAADDDDAGDDDDTGSSDDDSVHGTVLSTDGGVTVIRVWGTHEQRGYAQGYLLADQALDLFAQYIRPSFLGYYEQGRVAIQQPSDFAIPQAYVEEAAAAAQGVRDASSDADDFDEWDWILINTFLDVQGFLLGYKEGQTPAGCSSLISWGDATAGTDLDGKSVATRHLDWSAYDGIVGNDTIVVHVPSEEDEQPWLSVGYAGFNSVLSGMNGSGLGTFAHILIDGTHGGATAGQAYVPLWYSLRRALEKRDYNGDGHNDVQDVQDALLASPAGAAEGYIASAVAPSSLGQGPRIAMVAEIAPGYPHHTFRTNAYPDNIPGENLYTANHEIARLDHTNYCSRYQEIAWAIGDGTGLGSEQSWDLMRDHSNPSDLGWDNLQFMQYIPEDGVLELAVFGDSQAYLNEVQRYDLESLFGR